MKKHLLLLTFFCCIYSFSIGQSFCGSFTLQEESTERKLEVKKTPILIKGTKMLLSMDKPGKPGQKSKLILLGDSNAMYVINDKDMTVTKMSLNFITKLMKGSNDTLSTLVTTLETKVIQGYKCKKYIIEGSSYTSDVWTTTDIKADFAEMKKAMPAFANTESAMGQLITSNIGFPILVIRKSNSGEIKTTTFTDIKLNDVTEDIFDLSKYKMLDMKKLLEDAANKMDQK